MGRGAEGAHAHAHLLIIARADGDIAIRGFERLIGHNAGVRIAEALRLLSRRQPIGRNVSQREHLSLQQRRLNVLAAAVSTAAAPVLQRCTPVWGSVNG